MTAIEYLTDRPKVSLDSSDRRQHWQADNHKWPALFIARTHLLDDLNDNGDESTNEAYTNDPLVDGQLT